jgi:hypothetical protein
MFARVHGPEFSHALWPFFLTTHPCVVAVKAKRKKKENQIRERGKGGVRLAAQLHKPNTNKQGSSK